MGLFTKTARSIRHVLLVEDNRDHIELMSISLRRAFPECRLSILPDGEKAVRQVAAARQMHEDQIPDVILLDINLPKIGGGQVLKKIRANRLLDDIPVIVCTTSSNQRDIDSMLALGADDYLAKADMEKELRRKVLRLVARKS